MADHKPKVEILKPRNAVIKWLLDSDPAIRWQAMRDLTKESSDSVAAERSRIATEGWGARLLDLQSPEGHWGGEIDTKTWMCTIHTLIMLKNLGLEPESDKARTAIGRVRDRITWWQLDGHPFFDGETEPCLNGGILACGAYFGYPSEQLLNLLLGEQLEDGGWNCEAPKSKRSSFHTTICVLEGLLEFERAQGASRALTKARTRAQEYLLDRHMFRALSSGDVIDRKWLRFSYPNTWHYDVLRGLDYLRNADVEPDERVDEAVALVANKQHQNGRWPLQNPHPDRVHFDMEGKTGTASRWNTLRALRVLDWYSSRR